MSFTSWEFAIFLPVVLAVYYVLARRPQNYFLLVASYVFYGWWDWRFLSLLAGSTLIDYWCARRIAEGPAGYRRLWLVVSLLANLGTLAFFKYCNFFVDSAAGLLSAAGMHADLPTLNILLPVGISFYTFQTLSYTIDVYRGQLQPTRNFVSFALYVSFFPQLVAGPIERASTLLPQLQRRRIVDGDMVSSGLILIIFGLFKKLAIADAVAPMVDDAFNFAAAKPWPILAQGLCLFALQIYGDFSGYTDIARGTARLLGISLMENFRLPYLAVSITDFWRRWHISLSSWLRDYLYIPLGGNRGGWWATQRNLFITMLLGGLWHGAAWTFVVWGALHGVYLMVHKCWTEARATGRLGPAIQSLPPVGQLAANFIGWMLTINAVLLAWIFFRARTFTGAWDYLVGLLTFRGGMMRGSADDFAPVLFFVVLATLADLPTFFEKRELALVRANWSLRGLALGSLLVGILLLGPENDTPFVYFQF